MNMLCGQFYYWIRPFLLKGDNNNFLVTKGDKRRIANVTKTRAVILGKVLGYDELLKTFEDHRRCFRNKLTFWTFLLLCGYLVRWRTFQIVHLGIFLEIYGDLRTFTGISGTFNGICRHLEIVRKFMDIWIHLRHLKIMRNLMDILDTLLTFVGIYGQSSTCNMWRLLFLINLNSNLMVMFFSYRLCLPSTLSQKGSFLSTSSVSHVEMNKNDAEKKPRRAKKECWSMSPFITSLSRSSNSWNVPLNISREVVFHL